MKAIIVLLLALCVHAPQTNGPKGRNPQSFVTIGSTTCGSGFGPAVQAGLVSLEIYDILGREVSTLVKRGSPAGKV